MVPVLPQTGTGWTKVETQSDVPMPHHARAGPPVSRYWYRNRRERVGGSALLIYGTVTQARLQPRPIPRTMLDRVLGRERTLAPTWHTIGRDRRMIDVPASSLVPFAATFRQFALARFAIPWAATRVVLDYLDGGATTLYVRGEADKEQPAEWYVPLAFSGCAGMAEVSAEVAAHWAAEWYRREQADLPARFLAPFGFEPNDRMEPEGGALSVPCGTAGYARVDSVSPDPTTPFDETIELDASTLDALSEAERTSRLSQLRDQLREARPQRCLCQLCATDLQVGACDHW
jgi:hypothetical protein